MTDEPRAAAPTVVAVVVTYNRRELLSECLRMLTQQTSVPHSIVVVDNASTDDTVAFVRENFPKVDMVSLSRNTGGAGGFSASRVVWTNGEEQPRNIPRDPFGRSREERRTARRAGGRPIRTASFVSLLIDAAAVREYGLPTADFFIWNDDFEFTARILRHRKGIYAPRAVVVHKTAELGTKLVDPGERFYNEVRNKIWTFRRGEAFAPVEAALWIGGALRNWLRFYRHSSNRAAMRQGLRSGVRDGLRSQPRLTRDVLAEAGYELAPHW